MLSKFEVLPTQFLQDCAATVLTAVGFKSQAADESTFDDVVPLRRCIRAIVGIHISDAPVMA